ncbi:hypothetical protein ES705_38087 [subsurface metagenome]
MREIRITQKDGVTHTIFRVGKGGWTFPDGNYEIARGWLREGLLCESSQMEMVAIMRDKIRARGLLSHAG